MSNLFILRRRWIWSSSSTIPLASSQFLGYLLEIMALLELLKLNEFLSFSWPKQLGDGPFSKKDPSPPDVAGKVLSITQIGIEFLHYGSYARFQVFAHSFPAFSFDFILEGWHNFSESSFLYKPFLCEILSERLDPLVEVECSHFSCFNLKLLFNYFLLNFFRRSSLLVYGLFNPLS